MGLEKKEVAILDRDGSPRLGESEGRKTYLGYILFRKKKNTTHRGFIRGGGHKEKKVGAAMESSHHID